MGKVRAVVIHFAAFVALACAGTGGPPGAGSGPVIPPTAIHLSGKTYDSVNGNAISGVLIRAAGVSQLTAADGTFDLVIDAGDAGVTGTLCVTKSGYRFIAADPISLAAGTTVSMPLPLTRTDVSLYPTTPISGRVYAVSGAEVPAGAELTIFVYGTNGASFRHDGISYQSGFTLQSPIASPEYLVLIVVNLGGGDGFAVAAQGMSSSALSALSLTASDSAWKAVTLRADSAGNTATAFFVTGYGQVPTLIRDSAAGCPSAAIVLGSIPQTVEIFNPFGWNQIMWTQGEADAVFNALHQGSNKTFYGVSAVTSVADIVTLPVLDRSAGPNDAADPSKLTYANAILSQPSVDGASWYVYELHSNDQTAIPLGTLWAGGEQTHLPPAAAALLGETDVQIRFTVADMDPSIAAILTGFPSRILPSVTLGLLESDSYTVSGVHISLGSVETKIE